VLNDGSLLFDVRLPSASMELLRPFPGYYVAAITGILNEGSAPGARFARLAMYSFDGKDPSGKSGTVQQHFWFFNAGVADIGKDTFGDPRINETRDPKNMDERCYWGSYGPIIGSVAQTRLDENLDANHYIQSLRNFMNSAPKTLEGVWKLEDSKLTVTFSDKSEEIWSVSDLKSSTRQGAELWEMELLKASYVARRNDLDFFKGWGYGGPGPDFNQSAPVESMDVNHWGKTYVWNRDKQFPIERDEETFNIGGLRATSTGIRREFQPRKCPAHSVFVYHRFVGKHEEHLHTARRTVTQNSHDFLREGHIANEPGHMGCGLQILDSKGNYHGQVFAYITPTSSTPPPGEFYIGVLSYLSQETFPQRPKAKL
jgi:hypothetical protein